MPGRNVIDTTGGRHKTVLMGRSTNDEAARATMTSEVGAAIRKSGMRTRMFRIHLAVVALLLAFGWPGAYAQSPYPAHTITLIVPFASGGPTDIVARALQGSMARALAQQIVIENVVGAGGTTAATRAMRAAPDGYTIMLGHMGTHAAALAMYPKLAYNPATDFAPIGLVVRMPVLVIARNGIPARDLNEFIGYANQHGSELTMAHSGVGSVSFVTCALFNSILGLNPKLAAYQGSDPAMAALLADKADYMCDQAVSVVPQAAAHAIRVYAVASPSRLQSLPDVPTAEQAGLPRFDVMSWHGLFAPKDTPRPIIDRLNAALGAALADATVRKALLELGSELPDQASRTPDALAALVMREIARWKSVLRPMEAKN
jgi:tripartite-type tricarboxylate transporter receptor subunit TctC